MAGLAASITSPIADVQAQEVLWSTGTGKPRFVPPAGAADCHFHTYDKSYPSAKGATLLPDDASPSDYRALQRRIGTTRGVIHPAFNLRHRQPAADRLASGAWR